MARSAKWILIVFVLAAAATFGVWLLPPREVPPPPLADWPAVTRAALEGDLEAVSTALDRGDSPEGRLPNGETALMLALAGGNPEVVRRLAAAGADLETRDEEGRTPLIHAVDSGDTRLVELLLELGAEVNRPVPGVLVTPLIRAAQADRLDTVRVMVQAGADVNAQLDNGNTALIFAASNGDTAMVRLPLDAGADPSVRGLNGTAMDYAVKLGRSRVVPLLSE